MKNIEKVEKDDRPECLKIEDSEEDSWTLCEPDCQEKEGEDKCKKTILEWLCALLTLLGEECEDDLQLSGAPQKEIVIQREIIKQPLIIIPLPSLDCEIDWGYMQNGDDWLCNCNQGF